MASKQDQIIEDDESETCPLCIEELDLSDRGFRPCPCGYQICQFCYNNIKTTMNGLCPACRRPYEEKNIRFEAPSAEETAKYRENKSQIERKRAAAKRQEAASRHADNLSRKHLAGIRVRRQNLVYVTGLRLNTSDPLLSEKLRDAQFFGQYGEIDKVVVNRPKDSKANQPVGVYITYFDRAAATLCIQAVNGSTNTGGTVRADYGTTKYCSSFLRHETCTNKNCTFLHEVGEDKESFTREGLSSLNASSTQQSTSQAPVQSTESAHSLLSLAHQPALTTEKSDGRNQGLNTVDAGDRPGLPSHASWAMRNNTLASRPSQGSALASGNEATAAPLPKKEEGSLIAEKDLDMPPGHEEVAENNPTSSTSPIGVPRDTSHRLDPDILAMKESLAANHDEFSLDDSDMTEDDMNLVRHLPLLFDPNGGARRFLARMLESKRAGLEKEQQSVSQTLSSVPMEDIGGGGSLQLGGEPDDRQISGDSRDHNLIGQLPSSQPTGAAHLGRAMSPASRNQGPSGTISQHPSYSLNAAKSPQLPPSRPSLSTTPRSFAEPTAVEYSHRSPGIKYGGFSSAYQTVSSQYGSLPQLSTVGGQGFHGATQGPPPGLKTTGTPPVSGGGMFGQGHGFAASGLGYGVSQTSRNANDEMLHELLRNRGGSAGSGQASDGGRRELTFPFSSFNPSPSSSSGRMRSTYGSNAASSPDHATQKQRKKGKKHRHADTSFSGGVAADVADPTIIRARLLQAGIQGQATQLQGPGGFNSALNVGGYGRW